jgi:hypothetical protein
MRENQIKDRENIWHTSSPIPTDEGMTNRPPIFAYLVFDPGRASHERLSRPIKAVA